MSTNGSSEFGESSQWCLCFEFVICTLLIGTACILGLAGNITSFVVLWKHSTETATTFLLRCLAVSDSLLLVMSIFIYSLPAVYPFTQQPSLAGPHENFVSTRQYIWPFAMMAHTVTIYLVVLLTWNRYCATCRIASHIGSQVSPVVRSQALIVVVFSVLYNVPRFFEHQSVGGGAPRVGNTTGMTYRDNTSVEYLGDNLIYKVLYSNLLYFPVMYVVPLLSLTYMNVKLIKKINSLKKARETLTGHAPREDHITVCIIVIVFVFILSQTPALVNQIFWAVLSPEERLCSHFHFYYTKISDFLVVLNSSCNFIIYCLFGKSFRQIFIDILCNDMMKRHKGLQPVPVTDASVL